MIHHLLKQPGVLGAIEEILQHSHSRDLRNIWIEDRSTSPEGILKRYDLRMWIAPNGFATLLVGAGSPTIREILAAEGIYKDYRAPLLSIPRSIFSERGHLGRGNGYIEIPLSSLDLMEPWTVEPWGPYYYGLKRGATAGGYYGPDGAPRIGPDGAPTQG